MDSLFFWLSKLAWYVISPDSLLIILFVFGLILMIRNKQRLAKGIFIFIFSTVLTIAFFPVGEWLVYPLEKQYPPMPIVENVDGLILLGGGEHMVRKEYWKYPVIGKANRTVAFIDLAKKYPGAKKIYTGGSGNLLNQNAKGADLARRAFNWGGLDTSNITFERQSRNTWENVKLSKKLSINKEGEDWLVVTSAWHMPRSVGVFCKENWKIIPYPVDFISKPGNLFRVEWGFTKHLKNLKVGIKEWIGIASYRITGKMCAN